MTPPKAQQPAAKSASSTRSSKSGRAAWGTLSREQILAAAIHLADRDGIEAVSIRKVAGELNSRPMSLYRHINSRDELLELMYDAVLAGDHDLQHSGSWRQDLWMLAHSLRDVALAHPWIAPMMSTGRPAFGPNSLMGLEWALTAVSDLGLPISAMSRVVFTVMGMAHSAVRSEILEAEEQVRSALTEEEWQQNMAPYLEEVINSGDYPLVAELLKSPDRADPESRFNATLTFVLDGLEQYIDQHA